MRTETALTDLIAQAWAAYDRGDRRTARGLAEQARAYAPRAPGPIAALAWFQLDANQPEAAAALLKPALKAHPDAWALWWYLGLAHQRLGDLPAAVEALRRACCGDPELHEAAFTLAWLLHDLGHLAEALAWSRYAVGAQRSPDRLQQLAWLALCTGAAETAAGLYRELLDLLPKDAPDRSLLRRHFASALEQAGDPQQALAVLTEEAAAQPDDPAVLTAQAWLLLRRDDPGRARALAARLSRLAPTQADGWHILGLIDQAAGDASAAAAFYAQALACDPGLTDLRLRRASLLAAAGEAARAEALLREALAETPTLNAAEDLLIQLLLEQRKTAEARARIHRRLRQNAPSPDLWRLLAITLDQRDRLISALYAGRRACRRDPANVEAHRLLGWLAHRTGHIAEAATVARRVVALTGGDGPAAVQAAFLLESAVGIGAATLAEAAAFAEHAVYQGPDEPEAWRALGHIRLVQQRWDDAEAALRTALNLAPDRPDARRQLAGLYSGRGRLAAAEDLLVDLLKRFPDDKFARLLLAETFQKASRYSDGLAALAPLRAPDWPEGNLRAASLLAERSGAGDWADAVALCRPMLFAGPAIEAAGAILARLAGLGCVEAEATLDLVPLHLRWKIYQLAIRIAVYRYGHDAFYRLTQLAQARFPEDSWVATAAFFASGLDEGLAPADRAKAARHWYRHLQSQTGLSAPRVAPICDDDKIRIAYLASYLHGSLLRRVLPAHDPARVRVYLYTDAPVVAAEWGGVVIPLTGTDLAQSCAANRIDVVIDTVSPHAFEGQERVVTAFAHRLAPVQIAWLGTWGTGGGLYDALLTDAQAVPLGAEALYNEEILRIPGGQWAWEPPPEALSPEPGPLPARESGTITFAATVRGLRLSPRTFATWAQILAGVPGSRLALVGYQAEDGPQQRRFAEVLTKFAIDPARVTYHPPCSYAALLAFYQTVDIALDAAPANGGLCLLDPLWMGVPFVSAAGPWASDRQGLSILTSVGLADLCGKDDADFVAIAIRLAQDGDRRADLRRTLRARVKAAPLTDGTRIARFIETAAARLHSEAQPIITARTPFDRSAALAARAFKTWRSQGGRLAFPEHRAPAVSVVLPSDAPLGLLWESLRALADQTGCAVDVCLDKPPKALSACVTGLRPTKRLRAPYRMDLAAGVILQADALAVAVAALDAEPPLDAVTGRLIAADGLLLEAGRLPARGTGTVAYGRGSHADAPEFRFRRLTPGAHPGFRVTRGDAATRILYLPEMVAQQCAEASPPPVQASPEPNAPPLLARWADRTGPRLLILDNTIPFLTTGAGLPRARAILHALAAFPATLFPLWWHEGDWREVYRAVPPTLEVMLGLGAEKLEAFLALRRGVYQAIMVSRPPNLAYLKALRARRPDLFDGITLIYDAEAVFAQREIGEAAIAGSPLSPAEADARIAQELAQAEGIDRILVVSHGDRALYTDAGFTNVRLLGHAIATRRTAPGPQQRQGLLFVGALDPKTPNEDSLLWFVEAILPRLPGVILSIAGECRSARVAALAGERVRLLGPQQDLTPFYDAARVFIAPTRFAGGVPVKVIEAAAHGIPVVATPLLVGQLGWTAGTEIIDGETPAAFADAVQRLLGDDALWTRVQAAAWRRVESACDPAAFTEGVRRAVCDPLTPLAREDDGEIVAQQAVG